MPHRLIQLVFVSFVVLGACVRLANANPQPRVKLPTSRVALLSKRVTKSAGTEEEKVRAIYYWITAHIRYDVKRYLKPSQKQFSPEQTIKRKKALCSEYAGLFVEMCKYAGITAYTVEGFAKDWFYETDDLLYADNHAWNIAWVEGKWCLYDLTFASGQLGLVPYFYEKIRPPSTIYIFPVVTRSKLVFYPKRNDYYYNTPPELFVKDHLPSVPMYQLLKHAITCNDFEHQHYSDSTVPPCDYESQLTYLRMNEPSYGLIWTGDSAVRFNCKNKPAQVYQYYKAANIQLNWTDEVTKSNALKWIDSAAAMSKEAAELISEDFRYRFRKNYYRNTLMGKDWMLLNGLANRASNYWFRKKLRVNNNTRGIDTYIAHTRARINSYSRWKDQLSNVKLYKDTSNRNDWITQNEEAISYLKQQIVWYTDTLFHDSVLVALNMQGLTSNLLEQQVVIAELNVMTSLINEARAKHFDQLDSVLAKPLRLRMQLKDRLDSLFAASQRLLKTEYTNTRRFKFLNTRLKQLVNTYMYYELENAKRGAIHQLRFNAYLDTVIQSGEVLVARYTDHKRFIIYRRQAAKQLYLAFEVQRFYLLCEKLYEQHRFRFKQRYLARKRSALLTQLYRTKSNHNKLKFALKSKR